MPIESDVLKKVCSEVYRQFPAVNGSKPKVQSYSTDKYLVLFKGSSKTASGTTIATTVRAVVSQSGKIEKITTSR